MWGSIFSYSCAHWPSSSYASSTQRKIWLQQDSRSHIQDLSLLIFIGCSLKSKHFNLIWKLVSFFNSFKWSLKSILFSSMYCMDNVFLPYRDQYKFVLLTSLGLSENFTQIVFAYNKQCNQDLEELQLPPNGGFCLSTIHLST